MVDDDDAAFGLDHMVFQAQLAAATGFALPVGLAAGDLPATSKQQPRGSHAFGRAAALGSLSLARVTPYGSTELEEGQAAADSAEKLLADTQEYPVMPPPPGGAAVKTEDASA